MAETDDKPTYATDEEGRIIVPLDFPLSHTGMEINELRFRRLKGKDLRKTRDLDDEQRGLKMIALLSGQLDAVIDEMDADDIVRCGEVIAGFMSAGRKTGQPRS